MIVYVECKRLCNTAEVSELFFEPERTTVIITAQRIRGRLPNQSPRAVIGSDPCP
jgi:hypothetical protein